MKKSLVLFLMAMLVSVTALAQSTIKGKVVDEAGEAIIGASVVMKGSSQGTVTDLDGNFTIQAQPGGVLTISYIGYVSQDVKAANGMRVTLKEDNTTLDDLVVVGYGVQKKSVVTAAISKVTSEDLNLNKPSRVEDALKGKVSGVQITQSSGQPGSDSKVRIRGIGSTGSSDPLYIVDGMSVEGGINYLNPTDIASVEILKDAASAAIYGARAANGVVLVTTKNGKAGKTTINYDFSYGWQNPWKKRSVLNANEYMILMNEKYINDGGAPLYSPEEVAAAGKGTDWQDEVFNYDAPIQQHQVSINGGNEKIQYFLSLGYFSQEGIVGGNYGKSNYERWSVRSNSTYTVFEEKNRNFLNNLKIGVNVGYSRGTNTGVETNSEYGSVLGSALAFSPIIPVYMSDKEGAAFLAAHPTALMKDGKVLSSPDGYQEICNPVGILNRPESSKNNEDKIVGSFWAELSILPGLKFKSSYGADLAFWGNDSYTMEYYQSGMRHNDQSTVSSSMNRGYRWQVENVLTYTNTFAEKHNLTVVLGQSASKYTYRNVGGTRYDLIDTDPKKANLDSALGDRDLDRAWGGTGGYEFTSLASYFGRLDYNYDERYMAQFTIRRDGSSHFGPSHKWANFPAVSLGWNVLNEPYMQNIKPKWFDVLKVRFSWGKNGNESIGNFRYLALMDSGQNYYFGGGYSVKDNSKGGVMSYGGSPAALANPLIKWEESEQIDLGLDMRFFRNRLSFGFDYYKKTTNGMLKDMPIPSYVGQNAPMSNLGDMENWGLEFELGWKDNIGDFSYFVNANASYAKNKLVSLGNASGEENYENAGAAGVGDFVHGKNGEVWPYFYGMKTNGIFQNWDEVNNYVNDKGEKMQPSAQPGDIRFVDFNGDGSIDDLDRTKIGKGMPDWTFGFTVGAEYKGFDFNAFFQGTIGNDVFDISQRGDVPRMNMPSWYLDRWTGEGTSNTVPRMTAANPNKNNRSSDFYVKDGSYVRLKNIQLGYTLPRTLTTRASIQRLRVYVAAENLLTITGYDGFDPELASGGYTTIGVDKGIYPQSRTISLGANITF